MSETKNQASAMLHLLPQTGPEDTYKNALRLPSLLVDEANPVHSSSYDMSKTKRRSNRFRTRGIVVFSIAEKPAVANIHDIAAGGVSFLYADELDQGNSTFTMDILIFDSQTEFEYLIAQVRGQVTSSTEFLAPKSNSQFWRYGVEFIDLNITKKTLLDKIF